MAIRSFARRYPLNERRTVILKGDNFAFGYSDTLDVKEKLGEQFMNVEGNEHEARAFKAKGKA